jgi:AraC family transcriptional activator of tynA and feaB
MELTASTVLEDAYVSSEERQEQWQQAICDHLMPMSVRLLANDPQLTNGGSIRHRPIGDLTLTRWDCPAVTGTRSRRHVQRADHESLVLLIVATGAENMVHGDSTTALRPGTALLCASTVPLRFATAGGLRKQTLTLPRAAFDLMAPDRSIGDGVVLAESNPLMNLLRGFLNALWSRTAEMTVADLDVARNSILTLVGGAVRPDLGLDDPGLLPALRVQMERWIDSHLSSGPITVAEVAAAHNISTRTAQRAFASSGDTVSAIVRRHRLTRARDDLVATSLPIATLASRWGYFDTSHFGREFRNAYGCSPRDYRANYRVRPLA